MGLKDCYRRINKNYYSVYQLEKVFSYFDGSGSILDVGCGYGALAAMAPERVIGLEINPDTCIECKRRGFSVVCGDATDIPFPDEYFDGVNCSHIIEHLQPERAFRLLVEVGRVLKNGGVLVIASPTHYTFRKAGGFWDDFSHVKPYYPSTITRYICHKGIQQPFNEYPYLFEEKDLWWRKHPILLPGRQRIIMRPLQLLSNFLYRYGMRSRKITGYILALRKIRH